MPPQRKKTKEVKLKKGEDENWDNECTWYKIARAKIVARLRKRQQRRTQLLCKILTPVYQWWNIIFILEHQMSKWPRRYVPV
jgi:hypothetical protein